MQHKRRLSAALNRASKARFLKPTQVEVLYNHPTGDLNRTDVASPAVESSVYLSYKG
jgi:hypothetical protein